MMVIWYLWGMAKISFLSSWISWMYHTCVPGFSSVCCLCIPGKKSVYLALAVIHTISRSHVCLMGKSWEVK